jgi:Mg2+ and Co2+ transporter CorA
MLRTEIPFRIEGWSRRILAVLLGEAFLGFLAIVALALALFPMWFEVKPAAAAVIDSAQWGVIGWFAVEFVVAFIAAPEKRAFVANPWRWVDLVTIAVPLASLLPTVSSALRSTPILRLARIGRLVSLGVRASGLSTRHRGRHVTETTTRGPGQVTVVTDAPEYAPEPAEMKDLLKWLNAPGEEWFHVSNPGADELKQIAQAAKLPAGFLETHLLATSYPHVAATGDKTGLFLWMPEIAPDATADRHGMFFLPLGDGLLSFSRRKTHAVERFVTPPEHAAKAPPFAVRMLELVLERVVRENERLAGIYEEGLRVLEEVPVRESQPVFFEKTFRLKKELSAAQADLWRLKGMLSDLADGRVAVGPLKAAERETFRRLTADVDYLYDTMVNIREEALSVIELHLNVVSFEMNRVMRVLAVVSCLGLVPAVVGGLFGMNLIDNPWPFTLPQVAFVVVLLMVLGLYFFFVKGWLR